jgi:splicing factor 3B subunit 2
MDRDETRGIRDGTGASTNDIYGGSSTAQEALVESGYEFIRRIVPNTKGGANRKERKRQALRDKYESYKAMVPYPDIFEIADATCEDPVFYNLMKGTPGSVPVPGMWKSSSGRLFPRGHSKPRYTVPLNVEKTGVPALRRMLREHEAKLSLREKIREKLYPRLGKSSVDQQALYGCFFAKQWRPALLRYGDVLYPDWSCEAKRCKPGVLSTELMEALGIDEKTPPPWIFNMQKHGEPPSYPGAKIPGLNAPIPEGCQYGYQPMGWGEPITPQKSEEVKEEVQKRPSQYTTFVYVEEMEERVEDAGEERNDEEVKEKVEKGGEGKHEPEREDRRAEEKSGREKHEPERKRKKGRREELLKNVKF